MTTNKMTKQERVEQKKKRDEEWAKKLRIKQKHATKLRTGRNHNPLFSDITLSRPDGSVEIITVKKKVRY